MLLMGQAVADGQAEQNTNAENAEHRSAGVVSHVAFARLQGFARFVTSCLPGLSGGVSDLRGRAVGGWERVLGIHNVRELGLFDCGVGFIFVRRVSREAQAQTRGDREEGFLHCRRWVAGEEYSVLSPSMDALGRLTEVPEFFSPGESSIGGNSEWVGSKSRRLGEAPDLCIDPLPGVGS